MTGDNSQAFFAQEVKGGGGNATSYLDVSAQAAKVGAGERGIVEADARKRVARHATAGRLGECGCCRKREEGQAVVGSKEAPAKPEPLSWTFSFRSR